MAYTGVQILMGNLKQLIEGTHNPVFNDPSVISQRPQFQHLYEELDSIIQSLSSHEHQHLQEPQQVTRLRRRFKEAALEAEFTIDAFLSFVHCRNEGHATGSAYVLKTFRSAVYYRHRGRVAISDFCKTFLCGLRDPFLCVRTQFDDVFQISMNLDNVMRSIESIKVEFMAINLNNMKMDVSPGIGRLKTNPAAAGTSRTRNPIGTKKPAEEVVVGHDRDVELIRDKLVEDQKQLDVVSVVGMGGLGKTTLATKVFNDPFIVYHFHVRAWVAVSQTYEKRDLLVRILKSIGEQVDPEKESVSELHGKLHKRLMGERYLIVIDDIWSNQAWDDLKIFFPNENTGSRILLTTRINEVALHVKPHGFVHSLPYLTIEESWELLRKKVFRGSKCPEWLIETGMKIAKRCQGLPLSLVLVAGILAKEPKEKNLWVKVACSVSSYIANGPEGHMETLALSYHHLPLHLRECFLYLGGFPEDFAIGVKRLMWLWMAEGFIKETTNQCMEDTAKAYVMDLIDRNLLMVAEVKFDGDVKVCKLHDLVRELCLERAKEERFFVVLDWPLSGKLKGAIKPYEQQRVFTYQGIEIEKVYHLPPLSIRSFLDYSNRKTFFYDQDTEFFRPFTFVRVLDMHNHKLINCPRDLALLVHLRHLAFHIDEEFPSTICKLWSLQTLIIVSALIYLDLPSNISDLVNLRNLWSNTRFRLASIDKPMNLKSISRASCSHRGGNFQEFFPRIKKLVCISRITINEFESLSYLETLKLMEPRVKGKWIISYPTSLKKLILRGCCLPWSHMTIIQSLPNLEVLQLEVNSFWGFLWKIGELQFRQLKFLKLESLNIKRWKLCSNNFPRLKRLEVTGCDKLVEIPLEIGDVSTLELLEVQSKSTSIFKSLQNIQSELDDVGNSDLKIKFNSEDLAPLLQGYDEDDLIDRWELK